MQNRNEKKRAGRTFMSCGASKALALLLAFTALLGILDFTVPDSISRFSGQELPSIPTVSFSLDMTDRNDPDAGVEVGGFNSSEAKISDGAVVHSTASASFLGILPLKKVNVNTFSSISLIPGGIPFGVKISTAGVLIVGTEEIQTKDGKVKPAQNAGLRVKDVITHVADREINTAEELTDMMEKSGGAPVSVRYTRNGREESTSLIPALSSGDGRYKAGLWVKDSTAGIGTVTYIVPETGAFGGLGHGICDAGTGELMPMRRGTVTGVSLSGVKLGEIGTPGELRGVLGTDKLGNLTDNTDVGVFGVYLRIPETVTDDPIPIALSDAIHPGEAEIICTLADGERKRYGIRIGNITKGSPGGKNFVIEVTDDELIKKAGGIVQGMSGSPIIQDGHLVGAVTHVLISDPRKGYGILIENMLSNMPGLLL